MSEPVMSPDGKHMWTGSEWIPAPPDSNNVSVSLQDSVVTGDINTEINYATTINKNIINDNETTIRSHMKSMLEKIKSGNSTQAFEIYERAKQIDFELAKEIYEKEFFLITSATGAFFSRVLFFFSRINSLILFSSPLIIVYSISNNFSKSRVAIPCFTC